LAIAPVSQDDPAGGDLWSAIKKHLPGTLAAMITINSEENTPLIDVIAALKLSDYRS
jgi:hypothetical protein